MTASLSTRRVVLARRPEGQLRADDLAVEAVALPPVPENGLELRTLFLSVDPFLRLFLDEKVLGVNPGLPLGAMIPGAAVSEVVSSSHPDFAVGERVEGRTGWCEASVSDGNGLRKLSKSLEPSSLALSVAGLPGITAHTGLLGAGELKSGETVIISSAAGSVGMIAGQIAAIVGARAIGIAGGDTKCKTVRQAGFADCLDYRAPDFAERLQAACPGGADLYFDNVGGDITLAACAALRRRGRVVLCGLLSQYQSQRRAPVDRLPAFMGMIMTKTLSVRAFTGIEEATAQTYAELEEWARAGRIAVHEHRVEGIENAAAAMVAMLDGRFTGKAIVHVG